MKRSGSVFIFCVYFFFNFSLYKDAQAISFNINSVPPAKLLGSYSTPLLNSSKDRIYNIELGAKKIDGYRLKPKEIFSFNAVVGRRTRKNGFRVANIIVNDKYVKGVGGGVCQLSTTLYNAVEKAGLKIIERHQHSMPVNYVLDGKDATVYYGVMDFKFENSKNYTIEIRAEVKNKMVYVSIWKVGM